ncbi:hypothetical protein D0Z00_001336 [Geotrichum galactomycetum]|uniref:Uncharacterized protein n=1 Tax=Geotrichum galactomycetum TaxID=27317 RepID=A0ACB6V7J7_9ASCO|nr:hypothetical protein D0Z00_001336 [Geotrichum candidum]
MLRALNSNSRLRALRLPQIALATGGSPRLTALFFSSSSSSAASNAASPVSEMYLADVKAPICSLKVQSHFEALPTARARKYAHHMARAAHAGTRVVLRQVSAESEAIYDLIMKIHAHVQASSSLANPDYFAVFANENISNEDIQQYLDYASQFLSNLGNYKSFGDTKFVPRVSREALRALAVAANAAEAFDAVRDPLYSTSPEKSNLLGHLDQGHVTTYYSTAPGVATITQREIAAVQAVVTIEHGVLPENSTVHKIASGEFEFRIASAEPTSCAAAIPASYELPNGLGRVTLVHGAHAREMALVVRELEAAAANVANDTQARMLAAYIDAFRTGSMEAHKQSQREWVHDAQPLVETNVGFIETYRDPAGVRGEWEGLVAMVNAERTAKFSKLVRDAEDYIAKLPWPREFEKDTFTAPDFTSLEVLAFAGSGIPAGINIPNYDDIRQDVGFKNVSLGNVLSAKQNESDEAVTFLHEADQALYKKYHADAFEMQVGVHELLGHGTGRLFTATAPAGLVHPGTGEPVTTYYAPGETWGSVFGAIAASYEECRAELVAMYLATEPAILETFGHATPEAQSDVAYAAYLQMARAGLLALEYWDPATAKWGQAHMQARFSILKCFLDAGLARLVYTDSTGFLDLTIELDRTQLPIVPGAGHPAVARYLQDIHSYKCAGDVARGRALYSGMSDVEAAGLARFRPVVLAKKQPRKQLIQPNTFASGAADIEFRDYPETHQGMIQSFFDRAV